MGRAFQTSVVDCLLGHMKFREIMAKKSDGITMFAYIHVNPLRLDCTFVDTFACTHVNGSTVRVGSTANAVEAVKECKYQTVNYC